MNGIPQISGVFPAMLTMFTETGALDEEATQRHADFLIKSGVHGLVACGTSGEFIALTRAERLRVVELVVQAASGRVPVYAGTGHYSTRMTIDMTQAAEKLGAAGAIIILPYYQKPPRPNILDHFRALRRETGLPIMMYNNPSYAGCVELTSREIAGLAEEGVIQSIKSTFESVVPVQDLLLLCGERLRVFYGSFQSPMEAMMGGAHGWVSGFLNFFPAETADLYEACQNGEMLRARESWRRLLPFKHLYTHQLLGPVSDLAIYRAGLPMRGQHGGHSRAPIQPLDDRQRAVVRKLLEQQGMLA